MNVAKRIFFTWDERLVAFNSFQEGTAYLREKYGVVLKDIPEGWCGFDRQGVERYLFTTIIHYNDGIMFHG